LIRVLLSTWNCSREKKDANDNDLMDEDFNGDHRKRNCIEIRMVMMLQVERERERDVNSYLL
jgi:hypothetical protein